MLLVKIQGVEYCHPHNIKRAMQHAQARVSCKRLKKSLLFPLTLQTAPQEMTKGLLVLLPGLLKVLIHKLLAADDMSMSLSSAAHYYQHNVELFTRFPGSLQYYLFKCDYHLKRMLHLSWSSRTQDIHNICIFSFDWYFLAATIM